MGRIEQECGFPSFFGVGPWVWCRLGQWGALVPHWTFSKQAGFASLGWAAMRFIVAIAARGQGIGGRRVAASRPVQSARKAAGAEIHLSFPRIRENKICKRLNFRK